MICGGLKSPRLHFRFLHSFNVLATAYQDNALRNLSTADFSKRLT